MSILEKEYSSDSRMLRGGKAVMTFKEACKTVKEHGMKKNFNCDNISVLEFYSGI